MIYQEYIKKYDLPSIEDICNYYGQIEENLPSYMLDLLTMRYYQENA